MKRKLSDLPDRLAQSTVEIVKPFRAAGPGKSGIIGADLRSLYNNTLSRTGLDHVGSVNVDCVTGDNCCSVCKRSRDCGGTITVCKSEHVTQWPGRPALSEYILTCSNPKCGLMLASNKYTSFADFEILMFNLMVKQAVPNASRLNYADCIAVDNTVVPGPEGANIRALGVISIAYDAFWGHVAGSINPLPRSLGYTVALGLDTIQGQEFAQWLQFLFEAQTSRTHDLMRKLKAELLGPKPARE